MCNYCSKIYNSDELSKLEDSGNSTGLIRYDNGEIGVWCACDDFYYSGVYLHNVHHCPFCGEKLN